MNLDVSELTTHHGGRVLNISPRIPRDLRRFTLKGFNVSERSNSVTSIGSDVSFSGGRERSVSSPDPPAVVTGTWISLKDGRTGVVRFVGHTHFSKGFWIGIELDEPYTGKNDGTIDDQFYFRCQPNKGLFTRKGGLILPDPDDTHIPDLMMTTGKSFNFFYTYEPGVGIKSYPYNTAPDYTLAVPQGSPGGKLSKVTSRNIVDKAYKQFVGAHSFEIVVHDSDNDPISEATIREYLLRNKIFAEIQGTAMQNALRATVQRHPAAGVRPAGHTSPQGMTSPRTRCRQSPTMSENAEEASMLESEVDRLTQVNLAQATEIDRLRRQIACLRVIKNGAPKVPEEILDNPTATPVQVLLRIIQEQQNLIEGLDLDLPSERP